MANEKRLIDVNAVYALFDANGFARLHVADIDQIQRVDAVEVVRCKDCKHLNLLNGKEIYANCTKTKTVFLPFELDTRTHFCSCGERRSDA